MEAELADSFTTSIRAAFDRVPPDAFVGTVVRDGWTEAFAEDPEFMVSCVFEEAGRRISSAPVVDLLVDAPGDRWVMPRHGRPTPARMTAEKLEIDGITLGSGDPRAFLVGFDGHSAEGQSHIARVPSELLSSESRGGLDPQLGMRAIKGSVPLEAVAILDDEWLLLRDLLRRALSHVLIGVADGVATSTRQHVLSRTQFGRPIGSWQTVQHRLADVHVQICAARAALASAWRDPGSNATAVAKLESALAARESLAHAQQLFGAMGFTWEHGLHLAVRRWRILDALLGSEAELAVEVGSALLAARSAEPAHIPPWG